MTATTVGRPAKTRVQFEVAQSSAIVGLVSSAGAGLFVLFASYIGISGTPRLTAQVWWLALGIMGLVCGGAGSARFLLAQFQALRLAQAEVFFGGRAVTSVAPAHQREKPALTQRYVVSGEQLSRYHISACALIRGKTVAAQSVASLDARGMRACGMCHR